MHDTGLEAARNAEQPPGGTGRQPELIATGLVKRYGGPAVLDGAEIEVAAGEIVAVMGRSGSGKSTLLKLIGGLDSPDHGSVIYRGTDLALLDDHQRTLFRRHSLGFVFQFFNLIPTLTVRENVELPLALAGHDKVQADRRITAALDELELVGLDARLPDELSGGEQQRVAIARALIHQPRIVIADEPTGNLDEETAKATIRLLQRACRDRGTAILLATHSAAAASIADRLLHLKSGRLVTA